MITSTRIPMLYILRMLGTLTRIVVANPYPAYGKGKHGRIPDFILKGIEKPSFGPGRFVKAGRVVRAFIKGNPRLVGGVSGAVIGNVINDALDGTGNGLPSQNIRNPSRSTYQAYRGRRRTTYRRKCKCHPRSYRYRK